MTDQLTDLITGKPLEPWAQQMMDTPASHRLRGLAKALDCPIDHIEDVLADIIADSFDMDWTSSDGARAIFCHVRDSDGNPKGGDACGSVHESAAIAQPSSEPTP